MNKCKYCDSMIAKEWTVEIQTQDGVIYICKDCHTERRYKQVRKNNYKRLNH